MEGKNRSKFEKYKGILENICKKHFIRWQKVLVEERSKKLNKKLKVIDNKLNED